MNSIRCQAPKCDRRIVPGSWFCLEHWAIALPESAGHIQSVAGCAERIDFGYLKSRLAAAFSGRRRSEIVRLFENKNGGLQELTDALASVEKKDANAKSAYVVIAASFCHDGQVYLRGDQILLDKVTAKPWLNLEAIAHPEDAEMIIRQRNAENTPFGAYGSVSLVPKV